MEVLWNILTSLLLISFLFTSPSTAEIKSIKIRSDNRPTILFQKFGFTNTGRITVAISNVSVISFVSVPCPSRLGFFLVSDESITQILVQLQQTPDLCLLDSLFVDLLFTFKDLSPPPQSSFRLSHPVTYASEYSLFFTNCNPQSLVTMDVHTKLFNTHDRTTNDYLSAGFTQLPSLYFIFSLVYLCFLSIWICFCFKNQRSVHRAHLLMGALLTMKTISLFCAAKSNLNVQVTGTPHGWNVPFHIFQSITSMIFFTVIILNGAGWPNSKPVLQEKGTRVLIIVIPLQVLASAASIVISETGPFIRDWVTWNQVFLVADIICCCAVIFPIAWSIRSFSKTDRNLTLFRLFRVLVVSYLFCTRIGVFGLKNIAGYEYQWVFDGAVEMASLVLYVVMFYMFRPVEEKECSVLDDQYEEKQYSVLHDQ